MPSVGLGLPPVSDGLYHGYEAVDVVPSELYAKYDVKRGLRNADGSGVLVGLTTISNVHGYNRTDHGIEPDDGDLVYRGYHVADLITAAQREDRFGYEEVAYLLIAGKLPTREELDDFRARIDARKQLPEGYLSVFPRATYSHSIMNVLQRATLLLYAFDPTPDDISPTHEIDVALSLLGRWPRTAAVAHAAHVAEQNDTKLMVPPVREGYSMAETVLDVLKSDEGFTHEEAMLLDVMLVLHAEHGGGNNSTFTTRVLSSSGTDAYSAYAAAIGSLKGPKHGGANFKAGDMIEDVAAHVRNWDNDDEVADYLAKILRKEAFDGAGLLYGLGHAVYTKTDPRAEIIREYARKLAEQKGQVEKLDLIASIERLGPQVMRDVRGITKPISTNIDMYTGFVYSMLGIPQDLFTPIFAMARLAGWTAHRMEELYGAGRIIRPAYNSVMPHGGDYVPLAER
ncbi:MAG TPA: citrate synthase [Candidatus Olsenella pullistercoris]|uniref:Citrate synthase n=1 Tax=Candidatus Olsenella pullistercoris TaxID=2838712 RepID=A0A9D2JE92_9ACTN|nr:citrate synthase [Candidatus Olsenella pullistercoris]